MQFRKASLGQVDLEARSVPVVLATNSPVEREGFIEILDMSRVDLSRGNLPLIESHNASQVNIGVIRSIHVEGEKLRGTAVFGMSARAAEVLADVNAGIVQGVSIGYRLTDEGQPVVLNNKHALRFGFMPYEASIVAIPADTGAGFYRSANTLHLSPKKETIMETSIINDERNHAREISHIAKQFNALPGIGDMALRAIQEGKTIVEFRELLMVAMSAEQAKKHIRGDAPAFGASDDAPAEVRQVLRTPQDFQRHYAGVQGAAEAPAISLTDFVRGVARMKTTDHVVRALSIGTDTAGGYTVPTVVMPEILMALAPASSLITAGAGIVPLQDGAKSYNFAAIDALPTAAWRLEAGAVAESDTTFRNVQLTPRSLSFRFKISRELLADSVGIDNALRVAIAMAFAKEIDRAGLRGTGTAPEPRGLKNISGVQTVTNGANGAALAGYSNFFSGIAATLNDNAPMPNAAIMAPRSLVKLAGLVDTTGQPIAVPPMLVPLKQIATSQIPVDLTVGSSTDCSEIYLGDFTQMFFGLRENLSIQLLTELYAATGEIGFVCHSRIDVAVRYAKAFALITGVRA